MLKYKKIIKIEKIGIKKCYDLEVPKYHNFILGNNILSSNSYDLDTRYYINYLAATQEWEKFPEALINQSRFLFVPYSAPTEAFKSAIRSAGLARNIQMLNNTAIYTKKNMRKHEWFFIDRNTQQTEIISPIAPLSEHAETTKN